MKGLREIYKDAKETSLSDVKDFITPHFSEQVLYCVEAPFISLPFCIAGGITALILGESALYGLPAAAIPQALTYAGLRGAKLRGYFFEKRTHVSDMFIGSQRKHNPLF